MKVAPLGEVKNNFTKFIAMTETEPVFVTRNGRVTAVIEHITDAGIEDFLLERSPKFRRMLDKVKKQKGGKTLAEVRKLLGV